MPFTIRLDLESFTQAAALAGFTSEHALAKRMDVHRSTVSRVLKGELQPGPAFVAGALIALSPHQFADLFTIVHLHRRPERT
ncbi:transcriptional regulator [Saccharothrix saharensis]|uniref:transcriptional regulator n=1 Tax=Saccharothrix saharensis TaxID=571190 RepID=UPI00368A084A